MQKTLKYTNLLFSIRKNSRWPSTQENCIRDCDAPSVLFMFSITGCNLIKMHVFSIFLFISFIEKLINFVKTSFQFVNCIGNHLRGVYMSSQKFNWVNYGALFVGNGLSVDYIMPDMIDTFKSFGFGVKTFQMIFCG